MSDDTLLRIVGEIYEAAGAPGKWSTCLSSIREWFDGTAAHLLYHNYRSHAGGISQEAGLDPAAARAYVEHYHRVDPWALSVGATVIAPGQVIPGHAVVPHERLIRTGTLRGPRPAARPDARADGVSRGAFGRDECRAQRESIRRNA